MPEEKKESFTFSDKIKSSKPAGSKSFAKSSSKIGRDGKPRQTLFERTRRDAPFFIAALVALLLLPFLYKYSGSGSESTLLTPGDGEAIFNPEQYGFDTARLEDPDAQIAQLSGKSTFDLINWGKEAELEDEDMRTDMDIDAAADASASAEASGLYDATHSSRTDIDEEENITNIYKKRAKAGTRAAFKRTPIGNLKNASMKGGKGSPLKVKEWGGGMKEAANKVKDSGPRNAPKPVSLQPLRAGGPARSTFGQGGAAAARKGLDNMGKANAVEALRDSYVKPSETSTLGGISLAETGRSGGSGKLDHNINIGKGETPWWWDMMKTRMQKEWEARFNRKWDWIKWADKLAQNILGGLINCIITGNSDGDPDTFFGSGGGSGGKPSECCGMNEKKWNASHPGVPFTSDACKGWMTTQFGENYKEKCPSGWVAGRSGDEDRLGPLGIRGKCLGLAFGAYTSGELGLHAASGMDCEDMPLHYSVIPSGQARKWNIYTYVVVRNYFPESLAGKFGLSKGIDRTDHLGKKSKKNLLCASVDKKHGGTGLEHNVSRVGVGQVQEESQNSRMSIATQIAKTNKVSSHQQKIRAEILEVDQESLADACVMLVAKGNAISYNQIKNQIIDNFMKLGKGVSEDDAIEAFNNLDLLFVSSVAMKDTIAWHSHDVNRLPMPYWEFENAYINHKGVSSGKNGYMYKVHDKKWRVEGTDMMKGPICFYDSIVAECAPKEEAALHVKFNRNYQGGKGGRPDFNVAEAAKDIKVSFKYQIKGNSVFTTPDFEQPSGDVVPPTVLENNILEYRAKHRIVSYDGSKIEEKDPVKREAQIAQLMANNDFGYIEWTVKRGDQSISTVKCPFGMSGDIQKSVPQTDPCEPGDEQEAFRTTASGKRCRMIRKCLPEKVWEPYFYDDPNDQNCKEQRTDCTRGERETGPGSLINKPEDCPAERLCQDNNTWGPWYPKDPTLPQCKDPDCESGEREEGPGTLINKPEDCPAERLCQDNNTWGPWYPKDPTLPQCKDKKPDPETIVPFFERVIKVPCDEDIMKATRRGKNAQSGCLEWQGCKLTVDNKRLFQPLDSETKEYVKAAKEKFDKANQSTNTTLYYDESTLTVANLVDAIMIDPYNGKVPKNTVCLLGKTIGANARDPQDSSFDNIFGAFIAFLGYDAASFPSKFTTDCADGGAKIKNRRFPCGSQYWWGGYVDNGNRSGYKREVDGGPWRTFPLAGLLRTPLPTRDGLNLTERNDEKSRTTFHERYADLEVASSCKYPVGETIDRAKVLEYIDILCKNGEQIKPKAWKPCPRGKKDPTKRGKQGDRNAGDCDDC